MNRRIFADSFIGTFYRGLHSGATHGYSRKNPIGFIYLWCASLMLFLSSPHTEARGHDLSALRRCHEGGLIALRRRRGCDHVVAGHVVAGHDGDASVGVVDDNRGGAGAVVGD